jgi:hypothetical protein
MVIGARGVVNKPLWGRFKRARSKELVDDEDLVPPDRIEAG